jgi:FAD/FMN-containing dehydrogenase
LFILNALLVLARHRSVFVDEKTRRVRVQGGATLGDIDRETHAFGLAVPCGIVPKTGIGGLTLEGGVGWLIRKYGMSLDNLLSSQVVTADGKMLNASASENNDLFWTAGAFFYFVCPEISLAGMWKEEARGRCGPTGPDLSSPSGSYSIRGGDSV